MRASLLYIAASLVVALTTVAAPISWQQGNGYQEAALTVAGGAKAGFTLMQANDTGIRFTNFVTTADQERNHNYLNGGGVALGDVDGDGLCEIFFCNISGRTALYRNLGGWKFADVTQASGLALERTYSHGATFADVDGDHDLDLIVTFTGTGARLFVNDGKGVFADAKSPALAARTGSTSIALADADKDGDLDLYIANYGENTIRSGAVVSTTFQNGQEVVVGRLRNRLRIINGRLVEYGEPDAFYLNDGKGAFAKVDRLGGTFLDEDGLPLKAEQWDMGLSVMFRDINQDGLPDIYVCNDFQDPDRIWLNIGAGKFRAIARQALRSSSHFSMGVDFADIDRDGHDDFFTLDMLSRFHHLRMTQLMPESPTLATTLETTADRPQYRRNMLYHNRGDGTYAEIAQYAGVEAADWAWCPVFLDVDLDGYEDLLVANGHLYDTQDLDASARNDQMRARSGKRGSLSLSEFPPLRTPNNAFRNLGKLRFEEVGSSWGFNSTQVSHSIALADLDNDGDADVVVSCLNEPPLLYRNNSSAPRIAVRLKGHGGNTHGIGARVTLEGGAVPAQSQEIISGGRFIASDEPLRVFAAGTNAELKLHVRWPSGLETRLASVKPNHLYEIDERSAVKAEGPPPQTRQAPLFEDVSSLLGHRHVAVEVNDFEREPLLPRKLRSSGIALSWRDVNDDNADDLVVNQSGAPRETVYLNASGSFTKSEQKTAENTNSNAFIWADVNGDGALDKFIGGSVIPGNFPKSSPSQLLLATEGKFRSDETNAEFFKKMGLVNGATFTDINSDGWPDLAVACEWGPIRVFLNNRGVFSEVTEQLGFSGLKGWWQGVTTGDFDNDGRLDLVASNWGENTNPLPSPQKPLSLYAGDFDNSGTRETLLGFFSPELKAQVLLFQRDTLALALPLISETFPTHQQYSKATMQQIIGTNVAEKLVVTHFASSVFLNRGDKFEIRSLPLQAQFSPAFGIAALDFDGDGNQDVFLPQNFFGIRREGSRFDAGRGLLLKADGRGNFEAMSGQESGVLIYGEQRAAAASDYDADGRIDLAVAQYNDNIVLLKNKTATPGLRVALRAGPNAQGIGGVVRAIYRGGTKGPAHFVSAGSGYMSQHSATLILGARSNIVSVEVKWPLGKTTMHPISEEPTMRISQP